MAFAFKPPDRYRLQRRLALDSLIQQAAVAEGPVASVLSANATGGGNTTFANLTLDSGGQAIAGNGEFLLSLTVNLKKTNAPTGTVRAWVWAHTGTFGTSSKPANGSLPIAASVTTFDAASLGTSYATYTFLFDGSFQLQAGVNYIVGVVFGNGNAADTLQVESSTDVVGGNACTHNGDAGTWAASSTTDLRYSVSTIPGAVDAVGVVVIGAVVEGPVPTVTDSYLNHSGSGSSIGYDASYVVHGQSFTPSVGGALTTVSLWLSKNFGAVSDITLELRDHTGTYGTSSAPGSTVHATTDVVNAATLGFTLAEVVFTFAAPYWVTAGTPYFLQINYPYDGNSTHNINVESRGPGGHSGNAWNGAPLTTLDDIFSASVLVAAIDTLDAGLVLAASVVEGSATAADTPSAGLVQVAAVTEGNRNLWTYTQTFGFLGGWLKGFAPITLNAGTDPFGGSTATKITPNTSSAAHFLSNQYTDLLPSTTYVASIYAKAAGYTKLITYAEDRSGSDTSPRGTFDLSAGTVSGAGTIEDVGGGWYRCSYPFNSATGSSPFRGEVYHYIEQTTSYTGDGTSGLLIWGPQLEVAPLTAYQLISTTALMALDATNATIVFGASVAEGSATAVDAPSASTVAAAVVAEAGSGADTTDGSLTGGAARVGRVAWIQFFAPEGAGTAYSVSVVEGSTTSFDTPSTSFAAAASVVEGGATAVDTPAAANVTAVNDGEGSATATDTPSAVLVAAASVAEGSATATDTQNAATTIAASVAEGTATASDLLDAETNLSLSVSMVEGSTTAADTPSASYVTAAAVAESSTALDTPVAGTSTSAAAVEGSPTAVDTPSATWNTAALCSEGSATALDAPAAGTSTGASVAEVANTLFDSPSASTVIPAAVAEGTATATDTPNTSGTFAASLAEGANTALDTPNGSIVSASIGDVQEGTSSATDTCTALVLFAGSVAEGTASAQDIQSAKAIWAAFIAEAGAGQDTQDWAGFTAANVTEGSSTAADSQNAERQANAVVAEGGDTALDQQLVIVVYRGSIAEGTATAQDVASAGGIWEVAVAEVSTAVDTSSCDLPDRGLARTPYFSVRTTAYVFTSPQQRTAVYTPVGGPQVHFTQPPVPEPMFVNV